MPRTPRDPHPRSRLMAVLGLLAAMVAAASPARATPQVATAPAESHRHRCKCGMDCGAACCCQPKPKPRATPAKAPPKPGRAPCLDASPCGGEGLPTTPPSAFRLPRAFAPAPALGARPPDPGDRPVATDSRLEPGPAPLPPDEPPERRTAGA